MSHFVTESILTIMHEELESKFGRSCRIIEREHTYMNKSLPFAALNMGKNNDEYFLDNNQKKISVDTLLEKLDSLLIKDFRTEDDLSNTHKQAKKARSIADLYILSTTAEIVVEVEIFKDKPFSNLIYIPEVCNAGRKRLFHFIHCFAPKRVDREAQLTQKIGRWLMRHQQINDFKYESHQMPKAPGSIEYLLPHKRAKKPGEYRTANDSLVLRQYARDFYHDLVEPSILRIMANKAT